MSVEYLKAMLYADGQVCSDSGHWVVETVYIIIQEHVQAQQQQMDNDDVYNWRNCFQHRECLRVNGLVSEAIRKAPLGAISFS